MAEVARSPALALVALLAGCSSPDSDDWRFCLSREAYPELLDKMDANEPVFDGDGLNGLGSADHSPYAFLFLPLIMAVPIALDLVALPVTAAHDALAD